ncbi:MAG: transcription-repair coupling factor [Ruminococcaceae bacterium]|nr:transcription-repair coupling factor [Oscillospiraceae bacterium]
MATEKTEDKLFRSIENWKDANSLKKVLSKKGASVKIGGISSSGKAFFSRALLNMLSDDKERGCLYIAPNDLEARKIYEEFDSMTNGRAVLVEPYEYMLYDAFAKSADVEFRRMTAIDRIVKKDFCVAVTSPAAFIQYMPSPEKIKKCFIKIESGDVYEPYELTDRLISVGYERVSQVDGKGQFALRGDILDIFASNELNPARIEFFDNEIDTVRYFDVTTQRTIESVEGIEIFPRNEFCIADDKEEILIKSRIIDALENKLILLRNRKFDSLAEKTEKRVTSDIEKIRTGRFPGMDRYIPFITERKYSLADYFDNYVVILDEPQKIIVTLNTVLDEHTRICETVSETSPLLEETVNMFMTPEEFDSAVKGADNSIIYDEFALDFDYSVKLTDFSDYDGNRELQRTALNEKTKAGYTIYMFAANSQRLEKLSSYAKEQFPDAKCEFLVGGVKNDFISHDLKIIVMGDKWFSGDKTKKKSKKKSVKTINFFADVKPGDYVVHDIHGIGRFDGVEKIEVEGIKKDFIKISYKDNGVLYVPTYQLGSVEKYIGPEGNTPKINKLGGAEWNRIKAKVKESLRTYAAELVELYAKRSKLKGFAFSEDTVWQKEFEDGFMYEETDDQVKCSEEIKADMEQPRPMERLLCGDVGFGKTEVALRAAFKAICDGKQVAFLVPTTVLAMQHYKNFVERFKDFPVSIDYLCRFKTAKQREAVKEKVKLGKIDLLVGTHSILQKGIDFKNLGLLIIDEEQRFGVMHKEKLKTRWPEIDILSLSATPIPRTLHMSLSGIRDISVLSEPPGERLPVQTYVTAKDPALIKNAVYREMARHGQVFYLYNRVRTIEEKRYELELLIPEARIAVAHGQMSERELEDIIAAFLAGEYDMLLCTTIIESGIDMPNVNTMIIEDGDRLGLAQLYQIRGRVGRSNRLAYAYVLYDGGKSLTEDAEKRLRTIKEFTEFGSGFKIAMRDLEIRGAGSVLGERQHGQLAVVGYDAYCRLLGEVVAEEKGEIVETETFVNIEIRLNSFISSDYIEDEAARLEMYRKIANVTNDDDISELTDELLDRYGDVPENVINLMSVAKIRSMAEKCGFASIIQQPKRIVFVPAPNISLAKFAEPFSKEKMSAGYAKRITVNTGSEPYIAIKIEFERSFSQSDDDYAREVMTEIEKFLQVIITATEEAH